MGGSRALRPWGRVVGGDLLTQQLADGPLAAWPMQETSGTTMLDASGNGRHGTYNNVTLAQAPLIHGSGYSAAFSGSSARVADAAWMDASAWSVEVVASSTDLAGARRYLERDVSGNRAWRLMTTGGVASGSGWNSLGTGYTLSGGAALDVNTVYHLALVWDVGWLRHYVNGAVRAQVATTGTGANVTAPIDIGLGFTGRLSHAAFYDRALSADDILRHAQVAGLA